MYSLLIASILKLQRFLKVNLIDFLHLSKDFNFLSRD